MTTWRVIVTQLVPDHRLSEADDRVTNPTGTYDIEAGTEDAALDAFHETVPIACLDDFTVDIEELE